MLLRVVRIDKVFFNNVGSFRVAGFGTVSENKGQNNQSDERPNYKVVGVLGEETGISGVSSFESLLSLLVGQFGFL